MRPLRPPFPTSDGRRNEPMKNWPPIIVCALWTLVAVAERGCPDLRGLDVCRCRLRKQVVSMECTGPGESDRILGVLGNVTDRQNFEVQLADLKIEELPPAIRRTSALRLSGCNLTRLLPSPIFWPRLSEVVFETVTLRDDLWPQLQRAPLLRYLKMKAFPIPVIGAGFNRIPRGVAYLELKGTGTEVVEPGSMRHLKKLVYLHLVDVPLKAFPRVALPAKIPLLHTFILGNTNIESLEPTFFEGMPKLEVLMLNGNKFSTLDYSLFAPLRAHLTHLLAERNPLVCDCSLTWIQQHSKVDNPVNVLATCYDSVTRHFKEVVRLSVSEYCPRTM